MKQRIITGGIGGLVFLILAYLGDIWYSSLVLLLALIGLFEYLRMVSIHPFGFAGVIGFGFVASLLWPHLTFGTATAIAPDSLPLLLPAVLLLLVYTVIKKNRFHIEHAALVIIGALYIGFGFAYIAEARNGSPDGFFLTMLILLGIWSTDSGAYFVGRAIGKRKLWPAISPNKTVEGAVGGLLCGLLIVLVLNLWWGVLPFAKAVLVGLVTGVCAQFGDLIESAIKRHYDVKDSGRIFPGHGGVLDRVDSWLVVFPILHLLHLL